MTSAARTLAKTSEYSTRHRTSRIDLENCGTRVREPEVRG